MSNKRIVIAGTGSGVGKTTVTIGLMAALKSKGYTVQGFKCGPDYIDPTYHTAVTGRTSRNLDSYMLSHETVKEILFKGSTGADISIMEGVMGFYDGKDPRSNLGSTAEISILTKTPVLLVVNCQSMARSAAAIVKGYQLLDPETNIIGVIANKVGSEGHYKIVKTAIEQECQIPVVGYLKRENEIEIPERHLGLVPSIERGELTPFFEQLGSLINETIDVEKIFSLADAPELEIPSNSLFIKKENRGIKIAVARDAAFNFYYQENLELLDSKGAECIYFSPLKGEVLPKDVDGLYLGGGFPEEFAEELAKQKEVNDSIKLAIRSGVPTLAECGGFMYLTDSIETTDNHLHQMVGVIPGTVKMQKRLAALGYREISGTENNFLLPQGVKAKGHEFHYSTFQSHEEIPFAYQTKGMRGTKQEGYITQNLIAGYTHIHFASCPELIDQWLDLCEKRRES